MRRYFASYGLHTGALSAGHNILQISGTTTDVARALDAQLETVRLSNGTLAARLASRATVPHALRMTCWPLVASTQPKNPRPV